MAAAAKRAELEAKLSSRELTLIGALAGTTEVSLLQPIIFVKYAVQEGRRLPVNPLHYYRGYGLNVASFAPITATQFGSSNFAESLIKKHFHRNLTQLDTVGCAALGGAISSVFSSPSELVQIQQQRTGLSLGAAVRSVVQQHGALTLYRGWTPMLVRESIYTAAYLGLMPVLRGALEGTGGLPDGAPLLISGISAGVIGATASHPADTIKTRMQAFLEVDKLPQYRSVSSTTQNLLAEGGWTKLFAGLSSRVARIVAATFILNFARDELTPRIAAMKED